MKAKKVISIDSPKNCSINCFFNAPNTFLTPISLNLEDRYLNAIEFYSALTSQPVDLASTSNTKMKKQSDSNSVKPIDKIKEKGKGFDAIAGMTELKETLYNDVILPLK